MFFKTKRVNYKTWFELQGAHVPMQVRFELRPDGRASIGRSGLIVRLPHQISESEITKFLQKNIAWAQTWLEKHPDIMNRFVRKDYNQIRSLEVGKFTYTIEVQEVEEATAHNAKRKDLHIHIGLMAKATELAKNKAVKTLLSRIIGQHQKPWVVQRLLELNAIHFQKPVRNVYLKYNHSNWGSCSVGSNINLSTRLLFAPSDVIDYVIIHELAHLIEQNHSDRFWAQVARAMPEYELHERWLKEHGKTCDF